MTILNQVVGAEIDSSQWNNINNTLPSRNRDGSFVFPQLSSEDISTASFAETAFSSLGLHEILKFSQEQHSPEIMRLLAKELSSRMLRSYKEKNLTGVSKFLEEISSESYKEKLKKQLGLEGLVANLIQQMEHLERSERELDRQHRRELRDEERKENQEYRRESREEERRENQQYRQEVRDEERKENQEYRQELREERKKDFQEFLESVKEDFREIRQKLFSEDLEAIREDGEGDEHTNSSALVGQLSNALPVAFSGEEKGQRLETVEIEEAPENKSEGAKGFGEPVDEISDQRQEFIEHPTQGAALSYLHSPYSLKLSSVQRKLLETMTSSNLPRPARIEKNQTIEEKPSSLELSFLAEDTDTEALQELMSARIRAIRDAIVIGTICTFVLGSFRLKCANKTHVIYKMSRNFIWLFLKK